MFSPMFSDFIVSSLLVTDVLESLSSSSVCGCYFNVSYYFLKLTSHFGTPSTSLEVNFVPLPVFESLS